jgi:hypothetical protein
MTHAMPHRRSFVRLVCALTIAAAILVVDTIGTPPAAIARPKRLSKGLMSVGNTGIWPNIVDVRVTYLNWAELQPGPHRFRLGRVGEIVRSARRDGDVLRLRIFAGRGAPDWVKRRFGTVQVADPIDGMSAAVPRWWRRGYMRVYRRLQAHLAARFDDNPTIRAVTITGAMTIHGEPFIRGVASPTTRANLLRSGYTPRKDRRAIMASIRAHRPWHRTRQILNVNPWQYVRRDGSFRQDSTFTIKAMNRFRRAFGRRAILQNNSIRSRYITGTMPTQLGQVFARMRALGGPFSFQTARTIRVGDLAVVLAWCVDQGAHGVEVQRGASDQISTAAAADIDAALEANA